MLYIRGQAKRRSGGVTTMASETVTSLSFPFLIIIKSTSPNFSSVNEEVMTVGRVGNQHSLHWRMCLELLRRRCPNDLVIWKLEKNSGGSNYITGFVIISWGYL